MEVLALLEAVWEFNLGGQPGTGPRLAVSLTPFLKLLVREISLSLTFVSTVHSCCGPCCGAPQMRMEGEGTPPCVQHDSSITCRSHVLQWMMAPLPPVPSDKEKLNAVRFYKRSSRFY